MNLSSLLAHRLLHVRQARLANLAFAHQVLGEFTHRVARAGITGRVRLQHVAPEDERYCATLTALDSNQSVIEEHFTDDDVLELVDIVAFLTGNHDVDIILRVEEFAETLLLPVRSELEREGVVLDGVASTVEQPKRKC